MRMTAVLVAAAIGLVGMVAAPAVAADIEARFASVAPEGTPWIDSMKRIEVSMEAASGGKIDVQLFPAGQLGDELQSLAQIRRGRIEGGFVSSAALSTVVPEIAMIETPFLWKSAEELDYVVDTALFDALKPLFKEKGLILVEVIEVGWIHVLAGKPVRDTSDARGLKPRAVETETSMGFWRRLGANPVPLPFVDVLPSLQTGLVDGTDNDLVSMYFTGFHKAAANLTLTYHSYNIGALVLSKDWFDRLSTDQQNAVLSMPEGERARSRMEVRGLQAWIVDQMKSEGVNLIELDAGLKDQWRAIFHGFADELATKTGGNAAAIDALVTQAKADFEARKQ